jgi:hypothetical protein
MGSVPDEPFGSVYVSVANTNPCVLVCTGSLRETGVGVALNVPEAQSGVQLFTWRVPLPWAPVDVHDDQVIPEI